MTCKLGESDVLEARWGRRIAPESILEWNLNKTIFEATMNSFAVLDFLVS